MEAVPAGTRAQEPRTEGWSRPYFTAPLRGGAPGDEPPFERWEAVLRHEASIGYRAVALLTRMPRERPPRLAEREALVERVRATGLYRRLEALRSGRLYRRLWLRRGAPAPAAAATLATALAAAAAPSTPAPAAVGPLTSRRIEAAIDVLRTIPFEELQRRGWHFQPNHFYWPLNDVDFLRANHELWHDRGLPRDIDWDLDRQVEVARTIDGYRHELDDVPWTPQEGRTEYIWNNGAFGGADAVAYYGLVRDLQPRRVVEVGSGWSSLLLKRALARNETPCDVTLVEPFPNEELFAALPSDWEVHRAVIQHADFAVFERLQAGDVCFYDGSHCVRTAGDVNWFFFEVLPRLAPGVYVHVHDIFFPDDYHDSWVYDEGLSWNEQYLVQAFLMNNDAYRVHLANHLLYVERNDELAPLYASDGGSLWLEKLGAR
jgi:hypothetical protein